LLHNGSTIFSAFLVTVKVVFIAVSFSFNWNFGTIGFLDWFHGTDAQFRKEIQSKRHRFSIWSEPIDELFPDPDAKRR
jgi:hypothetical protein